MKVLVGYSYYKNPVDVRDNTESWLKRLRDSQIDVTGIVLTLNPPGGRLTWAELDKLWKKKDKILLKKYEEISQAIENYDVFLNFNGINLHPEFVKTLPVYTVYSCFDDPESSDDLSKPVAASYDMCLVGNIAEVETYKTWGVKNVHFWPLGFRVSDFNPALTYADILEKERKIDISLFCERLSGWRKERLDKYSAAFPSGKYYGAGWANGFITHREMLTMMQQTKISPNFHNSTGPINFRTYILPANGILQICDNKSHLAKIYKPGEEAAGFDTVEEAIELTHYYLSHDDERKRIAANGWKRAVSDYNEVSSFKTLFKYISQSDLNEVKKNKKLMIPDKSANTFSRLQSFFKSK